MIRSLQALRFYAAITIVIYHACRQYNIKTGSYYLDLLLKEKLAFGVDIFFVISGFVIYYSFIGTSKKFYDFLFDRMVRIAPMYWLSTLIFSVMLLLNHSLYPISEVNIYTFIKSLFFIPFANLQGTYLPIHSVGWTLNFEVIFYVFFSLSILITRRWVGLCSFLFIIGLFVISEYVPAMTFYHNTIVFEFALGMFVAFLRKRYTKEYSTNTLYICAVLGLCLSVMLFGNIVDRLLFWGIPAFIMVLTLVFFDKQIKTSALLMLLGASSYSLYLLHRIVISMMIWAFGFSSYSWLFIIFSIALSLLVSIYSFKYIEKNITIKLKNKYYKRTILRSN
ncbi:acyltransferase family protein [Yersinia kristensenii]|uniref:acyltransferase family protein n=1 Tax=Yersinia kristensenii TaxID=28152 RepID=UPI0001A54FE4|nr:acyltransferase [Yersinia kristensenii]EEP91764.1 Acyltransferase 3 [Yersinia kristensenii ATCC 33638]PEH53471.1 acyltransferase [Yersinia kristensenii]SUP67235.1 Acyltransferase family [Yersinia kristensenii]